MTLLGSFLLGYISQGTAETPSPLDAEQHPASPRYESLFSDRVVPLDAKLSWKKRFLGSELFNNEERLPPTSHELEQLLENSDDGNNAAKSDNSRLAGFDTTGVVTQVKTSERKVKIKHGPIERLGMPAMTMIFRVEDVNLLDGIKKGAKVAFNVDNSAAGFSITRLETNSARFDATGIVKQIKASEGKVQIKHGPIERLGMPAMTMIFRVEDISQLAGLEKGAKVNFNVENTASGFSISRLETAGEAPTSSFDALGRVKSVRASQGKVKIEHGPIDKLGMPGMTMMFKVRSTEELNQLEPGMQVEFDVINSSGGFEIPRIRPVIAAAPASPTIEKRICYAIGPFNKRAQAVAVSGRYRGHGATTTLQSRTERKYIGDMVYIDDLKTRDVALSTAKDLEARGIFDYIILNEPGKQNVLSLGVFGLKHNAASLKARIEALDYTVKTEARYRDGTVYWLYNEQSGVATPLDLLADEDIESGVSQIPGNCNEGEDA